MSKIVNEIRNDLKQASNEKTKASFHRFFKEPIKCYGVKSSDVGKVANKYWKIVETLEKGQIFELCEELLKTDYCEDAFVALSFIPKYTKDFVENDIKLFETWIDKYINNWAKCDTFCNHSVGNLIVKYPELVSKLKTWAKSPNRWLRRASAVSLIVPAKKGAFLKEALEIANILLQDKDDMVQKGYGWLLKEESRVHQIKIFEYVVHNKSTMPRTALRYAIELMPKELKKEAMIKNV